MEPLLLLLSVCWGMTFRCSLALRVEKVFLTSWSITLLIDWRLFVITIVVFIVLLLITRVVSIGSIAAAISLPGFSLSADIFVDYLQHGVGSVTYCVVVSLISLFPRRPAYLEAPLEYQTHSGRNGKEA